MHTRRLIHLAMCAGALVSTTASAADSPPSLIECLPSRVYDCVANKSDCDSMPVSNIQGAYVLKIDLQKERSQTFEAEKKIAETRIDRIKQEGQLLFFVRL